MRVKCVLCDEIGQLVDDAPLAKKLRNHPINTYMCDNCSERITEQTNLSIKQENSSSIAAPTLQKIIFRHKSEGRLLSFDRHKTKIRSGGLCHAVALTYEPRS